jgi:hypothetical protein
VAHRRVVVSRRPFSKLDAACRAFRCARSHPGPPEPIRRSVSPSCRKSSSAVRNSAGRCRRAWSRKRSSSSRCREFNSRCCVRRADASTAGSGKTPGSKARPRPWRSSRTAAESGFRTARSSSSGMRRTLRERSKNTSCRRAARGSKARPAHRQCTVPSAENTQSGRGRSRLRHASGPQPPPAAVAARNGKLFYVSCAAVNHFTARPV